MIDFSKYKNNTKSSVIDFSKYKNTPTTTKETDDKFKVVSLPENMGGGEYYTNRAGELFKAERGYAGLETVSGSERDHIMSVALGGTSNINNLQYLANTKEGRQEGKVSVEQKAINDYTAGRISLGEARMAVNYKQQQIQGSIPSDKEQTTAGQIIPAIKDLPKTISGKVGSFFNSVGDFIKSKSQEIQDWNDKYNVDEEDKETVKEELNRIISEELKPRANSAKNIINAIGSGLFSEEFKTERQQARQSGTLQTGAALTSTLSKGVEALGMVNLSNKLKSIAEKDLEGSSYINNLKTNGIQVEDNRRFVEKIQDPRFIAEGFSQSLPNMLFAMGVAAPAAVVSAPAAVTGGLVFGTTAALEGGFAYNEAKQFGATEEEATKAATITGIANGILEGLPIFKLFNRTPVSKKLKQSFTSKVVQSILNQFKRAGGQAVTEGTTESLQEIVSNSAARVYDENRNIFSGVAESAFFGALVGGGTSVGMDVLQSTGGKVPGLSIEDVSEQDTLTQEASKYKSADEFINSRLGGKIEYQAKNDEMIGNVFDIRKDGNKLSVSLKETPNELMVGNINADIRGTGIGKDFVNELKNYSDATGKTIVISDVTTGGHNFWKGFSWFEENVDKYGLGYKYKPKSQLTDIWNKAQAAQNKLPVKSTLTNEELKIQNTISNKDFETVVERFFPQVKDFYEDDGVVTYKDYLEKVDSRSIELELDSYESSNMAIRKLLNDDEIYIGDVVDMYKRGILRDEIKKEPFKLDVEPISDTKVPSKRLFFEPQKLAVNNKNVYDTAIKKVTPINKSEIMEARRKLYLSWASNPNLSKELGISQAELNKKIRSMTGARVEGFGIQQRVNQGVPEQFQWTGISNSNFIVKNNITFKDVNRVVNKIEKTGGTFRTESLSKYIMNTLLSIDTRLRYDDLNFRIQNLDSALGEYSNKDLTITINRESQNTVAHEIGHYLDYRFARELGIDNTTLSDGRINYDYLQKQYNLSDEHIRWAKEFNKFASNLVDKSEIGYSAKRAEYLQKPTEVFARFTAKFVDWTASKSGYNHSEIDYYSDKFSTSDFYDFIKLLQKKAEIDTKFNIKPIRDGAGGVNTLEDLTQKSLESQLPEGFLDGVKAVKLKLKKATDAKLKKQTQDKVRLTKDIGEFNQTTITDAKKTLGFMNPDKPGYTKTTAQLSVKELNQLNDELNKRIEFKEDRGFVPEIKKQDTKPRKFDKAFYDEEATLIQPKGLAYVKEKIKSISSDIGGGLDKYLGVVSTRLKNINPELKKVVRKLEYKNSTETLTRTRKILPFLEDVKKMSKEDFSRYDLALKNGDYETIKMMNGAFGLAKSYNAVKSVLDETYKEMENVGYDVGYQENYMPRTIKDAKGLLEYLTGTEDWSLIQEAIQRKEMALGRTLNLNERSILINSMIRGYSGGQITLAKTGAMKTRKIDFIDKNLNQFYTDSSSSLIRYIENTTKAINAKKFFGKELEVSEDGIKSMLVEDSVGAYTSKLLADGKLDPNKEIELREILTAYFAPRGTTGLGTLFKNFTYLDVMGSPLNAITQIGDLAFPIYKGGIIKATGGLIRSISNKTKLTKEDLGIDDIAQEFSGKSKLAGAVSSIFKLTGLTKIDSIGKNTLIDAILSKMISQAKKGDKKLYDELLEVFSEDEVDGVITNLQEGTISENVKYLLFNKLLDFQPVALSEVPEGYLSGGNSRIFYALKTWTIKMFDVYRNEAFQKINSADKKTRIEGVQNIIRLSMALALMNATADTIKDLIMGRKIKLNDLIIDNIAKLFGLSKYSLDLSTREGIGSTLLNTILPPTQAIDNLYKDFTSSIKANELDIQNLKIWNSVPIAGKLYYWWFGKGAEYKKSQNKSSNSELNKIFSGSSKTQTLDDIFK